MAMQRAADSEVARDLRKQVATISGAITDRAVSIFHEKMPLKIISLQRLSQDPIFSLERFQEASKAVAAEASRALVALRAGGAAAASVAAGGEARRKRVAVGTADAEQPTAAVAAAPSETDGSDDSSALIPSHPVLLQLISLLKKEVLDLIEDMGTMKLWIQLNIPRIEDGNNFGVSIQEETVSELSRAEDAGFAVLESMTKYLLGRAKLVSRVLKYPQVADYVHAVHDLDEKEFISLKLCCTDLRNNYAILYDMIGKNLERLERPRPSNHMHQMF